MRRCSGRAFSYNKILIIMKKVNFMVTSFEDTRKHGSELKLNTVFRGKITPDGSQIYFTDNAECDWVFWVGDTCIIVD